MGALLLNMAAVRRANKEHKNMSTVCQDFAEVMFDGDNALAWNVILSGPEGTPYEGGRFLVAVNFPTDYPFKPPKVTFTNPAQIYHPNVNDEGLICLDLLKAKYSPACSMPQVFNAIRTLMEVPSTDAPLRAEVGKEYETDRDAFNAHARSAWETHKSSTNVVTQTS